MIRSVFLLGLIHLITDAAFGQVFPVFPSGAMPDGSFYRSTMTVANLSSVDTFCTVRLQQDANVNSTFNVIHNFTVGKNAWTLFRSELGNAYSPRYAVVSCDQQTSIQVRYAYYSSQSVMLGEASVPSSTPATYAMFAMDRTNDNSRIGVALANDSDAAISVTVTVYDAANNVPIVHSINIAPRSTLTKFVDEMTGWNGSLGLVTISASGQVYVMGLRYTGAVFSSLPPLIAN
jgi:hypothetical protein